MISFNFDTLLRIQFKNKGNKYSKKRFQVYTLPKKEVWKELRL